MAKPRLEWKTVVLGVLKTVPSRKGFTGHACGRKGLPSTLSGQLTGDVTRSPFKINSVTRSRGTRSPFDIDLGPSVNAHVMHAVTNGHSQTHQLSHLQWLLYFCRQRCIYTALSAEASVLSRHLPTDQCMRNIVTAYPIVRNCNMPCKCRPWNAGEENFKELFNVLTVPTNAANDGTMPNRHAHAYVVYKG